jgi:excisionase family DNA binding protein
MRDTKENRRYLTTTQAARLAHLSPSTLLRAIQDKKLQAFSTPGGHFRVDPISLQSFIKASNVGAMDRRRILVVPVSLPERERLIQDLKTDEGFTVAEADSLADVSDKQFAPPLAVLLVPREGTKRDRLKSGLPLAAHLRRLLN